jgi:hypothetical protein
MKQLYTLILDSYSQRIHFTQSTNRRKVSAIRRCLFLTLGLCFLVFAAGNVAAQTYYSQGSSPVNVASNWNSVPGGGGSVPADFSGNFTWVIQSGHTMTMSDNWAVGTGGPATVTIEGGLVISSTYTVTVTGSLTVNGTLSNSGSFAGASAAITASGGITINGTYEHARDGGYLPSATWAVSSNCNITGVTATLPIQATFAQTFGNFLWNCSLQTVGNASLTGNLRTIKGNMIVENTGTGYLILGGNDPGNLTIDGNYSQTGGNFAITWGTSARSLTVAKDFSFSGGTFFTSYYTSEVPLPTAILNVAGNFSHTGGTISESSSANPGSIVFNGTYNGTTGMQTFTSGGTVSNTINFTVNGGAGLQMASETTVLGGAGTFTILNNGTLGITSANGITTVGTASGNIQTTVGRVFSAGANYIYNGPVAQVTGSGLMQNQARNLTIDNGSGVTLSTLTNISGLLTMTNGVLNMANVNLTAGSLTGSSNITNSTGTPSDAILTVGGDNSSPAAYTGIISAGTATTLSLRKNGTGKLTVSGTNSYNGTTTIAGGVFELGSATCIPDASKVVMNGGTLSTGASSGYGETAGTVDLQGNSTIALATGVHSLIFAASNGVTWGGSVTLNITGWSGSSITGGTAGKVFVGSDQTGLLAAQLAKITINGNPGVTLLSTGELVPLPAFRTVTSGNWGDISTWETSNNGGLTWVPATSTPDNSSGQITILNGHTVTVAADVTADEVTVASGGQVTISPGITLTIANGANAIDFTVNGTMSNSGVVISTGALSFTAGATYIHARDAGAIPAASWATTSNCNITGVTATLPTEISFSQTFGNFLWNCTGQTVNNKSLLGKLQTVKGNMSVESTGTGYLILGGLDAGNLTIDGSYSQTNGNFAITWGTNARFMLVKTSFSLSGGIFYTSYFTSEVALPTATLVVAGDFSHTGGTITESSNSNPGSIVFNGTYNGTTGMQTYTSGGTVSNTINFTVNSGAYLKMASESTVVGGAGTFTLSSGGTLGITSASGITTVGTASGNIQTTTGRVFNTGANYIYPGTGAQASGTALPATVNSLSVSGSSNLTLTSSPLEITNTLTIGAGANLNILASQQVRTKDFNNSGTMIIESSSVISNGSFIATGTLTQTGTVTYNRLMPAVKWHYVSSPVSLTSTPSGSYYAWDEVLGNWEAGTTTNIQSGKSYTLQTSSNSVAFTGTVVGSASVTTTSPYTTANSLNTPEEYTSRWVDFPSRGSYGGGGWNLLGNPFTSAMDAAAFVTANSAGFDPNYQALYIFDGTQYKYAGNSVPILPSGMGSFGNNIQAGQGFFVLSQVNGTVFNFDKTMQVHNSTVAMTKSASIDGVTKAETRKAEWSGLQLKVKYGAKENMTTIVFNENMTRGLDPGYDVGEYSSGSGVDIYTTLVSKTNNVNFARQALPVDGINRIVVPVGVNSEKGGEVTFSANIVPLQNYKFYLEDRKTGIFTNLNTNTYSVTLAEKTYGTGRFFLYTSTNIPPEARRSADRYSRLNLDIRTASGEIIIEGEVSSKAFVEIFDLRGRKVFRTKLSEGTYNSFPVPASVDGVFIVKVTDGNNIVTKRIVII